jgi:hypothetical protein
MLGKVLLLTGGLFLCGHALATEEKEKVFGVLEDLTAEQETIKQNDSKRSDPVPESPAPSQLVSRCARGVYSYDCSSPASVMKADLQKIEPQKYRESYCRNFLSPGWRCD